VERGVSVMAQDGTAGVAKVVSLGGAGTPDTLARTMINDYRFIRDLNRLKELRSFLIQEAIVSEDPTALSFGRLDLLRYSRDGVAPSQEEWSEVEHHTQELFSLLSEPLRRKFILGEIPLWVAVLPIGLMVVAVVALITAIRITVHTMTAGPTWGLYDLGARTLPWYLIWLISMGALGALAFVGMNALSVQADITFDITNRRLMLLRITLGALFGLVLTLPFGFVGFVQFIAGILGQQQNLPPEFGTSTTITSQALLLLLPFILGFSTPLVIMILNRLVDSVQAFFGKTVASESTKQALPQSSPRHSLAGRPPVRANESPN
jgi:hypothetical protein